MVGYDSFGLRRTILKGFSILKLSNKKSKTVVRQRLRLTFFGLMRERELGDAGWHLWDGVPRGQPALDTHNASVTAERNASFFPPRQPPPPPPSSLFPSGRRAIVVMYSSWAFLWVSNMQVWAFVRRGAEERGG